MQVLYPCCCGLDIHKKFVVACLLTTNADGQVQKESRTFSTMTHDLLALAGLVAGSGLYPCRHGEHQFLLAARLQSLGRAVHITRGQCLPHEDGAGTEDRREGRGVDRGLVAARLDSRQFHSAPLPSVSCAI